jgi:hypothetical protein
MFVIASARNEAPLQVSSTIAVSLPSRVLSHLGLDIPIVQHALWARSVTSAAVTLAVEVAATQMPHVRITNITQSCRVILFHFHSNLRISTGTTNAVWMGIQSECVWSNMV